MRQILIFSTIPLLKTPSTEQMFITFTLKYNEKDKTNVQESSSLHCSQIFAFPGNMLYLMLTINVEWCRGSFSFRGQSWLVHSSLEWPVHSQLCENTQEIFLASMVAQMVEICPQCGRPGVQSLGWKDHLEECMKPHSSILAWKIPMDRGPWWAAVYRVTNSWTRLRD